MTTPKIPTVPSHLIVHEVIGTYALSSDVQYKEYGSTADQWTVHSVPAGVYPVVLMSRRDREWDRFIRVLMPTTRSVYSGPQEVIERGSTLYFLVRYDHEFAAMVESGEVTLVSTWSVVGTWHVLSRPVFEGTRIVGRESYDYRGLDFTKDGGVVTLRVR